jgi:hypothetical protein
MNIGSNIHLQCLRIKYLIQGQSHACIRRTEQFSIVINSKIRTLFLSSNMHRVRYNIFNQL